jgi:hypothetical protein
MKKPIGYALLAFVGISLAFAFFQEKRSEPQSASQPQLIQAMPVDAPLPAPAGDKSPGAKKQARGTAAKQPIAKGMVIARYCHGHARCSNCIKIEQYSREAIEAGLRKDIDSGRLRFEVVNVDEPANRHYIQDYGLYTKSLVLISEAGGKELRHKVLNDVWNLLSDKDAFMAYVRAETEGFLK